MIVENVLAVYARASSGKKVLQKASMYFFADLGTDMEIGSLSAVMGLERWHPNRKA